MTKHIEKTDSSRIGMLGWSRGGMMAYLSMRKTDRLKTVVVGNGPTDLFETLKERPMMEEKTFSQCIPDYWVNKDNALKARSAIYWTDQLCPSTSLLILAGTQDKHVNHHQAVMLSEKLKETKIRWELKLYNTDHFFSNQRDELTQELIHWFDQELK